MFYARIWVHRRHLDFPQVQLRLQTVKPDIAKVLLEDGCAQDWQTDARRLIEPDPNQKPHPKRKKARAKPPLKAEVSETEDAPHKDPAPAPPAEETAEPSQADVDEAPKYRHRAMRAKK